MPFHVHLRLQLPATLTQDDRDTLLRQERQRGRELLAEGRLLHIWRITGRSENISIYAGDDLASVQASLRSLPAFPYLSYEILPLTAHPVIMPEPAP